MKQDITKAKPREIEAYLRDVILKTLGDKVENASDVTASHGYFSVTIVMPDKREFVMANFRRKNIREVARAIRVLGAIFD